MVKKRTLKKNLKQKNIIKIKDDFKKKYENYTFVFYAIMFLVFLILLDEYIYYKSYMFHYGLNMQNSSNLIDYDSYENRYDMTTSDLYDNYKEEELIDDFVVGVVVISFIYVILVWRTYFN